MGQTSSFRRETALPIGGLVEEEGKPVEQEAPRGPSCQIWGLRSRTNFFHGARSKRTIFFFSFVPTDDRASPLG